MRSTFFARVTGLFILLGLFFPCLPLGAQNHAKTVVSPTQPRGMVYMPMAPLPGDGDPAPGPVAYGELITTISAQDGIVSAYKNSMTQGTDGSITVTMTFVLDGSTVYRVAATRKSDGTVVENQAARLLQADLAARPSLMAQFRQQYDAAVTGPNGSLEPKISGFRCFIAWGGLAWAIASNNPWGIAGGLYDVGCSCFGWCF